MDELIQQYTTRIEFLKMWNAALQASADTADSKHPSTFNTLNTIWMNEREIEAKEHYVLQQARHAKAIAEQKEAEAKMLGKKMGAVVGRLRNTKTETKEQEAGKLGIIKRFKKGYKTVEQQKQDFNMALRILDEIELPDEPAAEEDGKG